MRRDLLLKRIVLRASRQHATGLETVEGTPGFFPASSPPSMETPASPTVRESYVQASNEAW
eukprot:8604983-Pyramimonas_sp.AAC.1